MSELTYPQPLLLNQPRDPGEERQADHELVSSFLDDPEFHEGYEILPQQRPLNPRALATAESKDD